MLLLLAVPAFLVAAAAQRYLARYAPSNVLLRSVRDAQPCWRTTAALAGLVALLLLALRGVELAIAAGAPSWFNLVALCIGWDAIKVAALIGLTSVRCLLTTRNAVLARR